jgi:ABC-type branched-subunit amino acid transport system substrate-binding protein
MKGAVDHLWHEGFRKFSIIYQNDAFGADCLEGVKIALKSHGAELVGAASYTRNKMDVSEAVDQIKKASPEVVFCGAVYKPSAEIVKLAKDTNWNPIFVMNTGSSVALFVPEAGAAAEGKIYTEAAPAPSQLDLPLIKSYQKSLKKSYPSEKPTYTSLRGYMDAVALVEGLKRAGKDLTRDGFVSAMESIHNLDVGLGKGMELSYSPTDHLGFHKVFFGTVKNSQAVPFSDWHSLSKQ